MTIRGVKLSNIATCRFKVDIGLQQYQSTFEKIRQLTFCSSLEMTLKVKVYK